MATPKWTEERTNLLVSLAGSVSPVTTETVETAAVDLETSTRSVASKLRKMGFEVQSAAQAHSSKYTPEQEEAIRTFVTDASGDYTYAQIGEAFGVSAKSIQGKILSMELTSHVKPTPKAEVVRSFTDADEVKFVKMANDNASIEDIAAALGRELPSVRGKALSLLRSGDIASIPKQSVSTAKAKVDPFEELGDISVMTVEAIAEALGKSTRGVKTMLTRRELVASDYDGAAKATKAASKTEAE